MEAIKKFECKRCGKCCLSVPCFFAQIKYQRYGSEEWRDQHCPDLKKDGDKYLCTEMMSNKTLRKELIRGVCEYACE